MRHIERRQHGTEARDGQISNDVREDIRQLHGDDVATPILTQQLARDVPPQLPVKRAMHDTGATAIA